MLLDLRTHLDELEIDTPPFTKAVGLPRTKVGPRSKVGARTKVGPRSKVEFSLRAHWVRPQIVVQVGFIQWTKHNKLRHPRLLGIRRDKHPREVVRE
jgi:ATP-dependent DNA ligase